MSQCVFEIEVLVTGSKKSCAFVDENTITNDMFDVRKTRVLRITLLQRVILTSLYVVFEQLLINYDAKLFQAMPSFKLDVSQE